MFQAGDIPIAGDWENDGIVTIGLFRRGLLASSDVFYLSNVNPSSLPVNGTIFSWDYTIPMAAGNLGDLPIVGDWTGTNQTSLSTGWPRIGIFRTTSALWARDNGNLNIPNCSQDQCSFFGAVGDKPIVFGKSLVKAN